MGGSCAHASASGCVDLLIWRLGLMLPCALAVPSWRLRPETLRCGMAGRDPFLMAVRVMPVNLCNNREMQ